MKKSQKLFDEAKRLMPGGVNSPVRAFKAVGGQPLFIRNAQGSKIYDADGRVYLDCVMSWGPLILGHANPTVLNAVRKVIGRGTSFGAPAEIEVEMARALTAAFPSVEMVRMVNSGTEAVMSAIRLARAYSGREKIIKFEGGYHGHVDSLLVRAGSGTATLGIPDSLGVPRAETQNTIVVPYNNLTELERVIFNLYREIGAVIVEPVAGNMGVVPPRKGFLEGVREITRRYKISLIFDEVITGFRVNYGGAQALYNVMPDITCMGKIIGGGFPVGAYGARREIMELVAPQGGVYQAGTLSGNPVALTAGLETIKILSNPKVYRELEDRSRMLEEGLKKGAEKAEVKIHLNRVGSMLTVFFSEQPVGDFLSARAADLKKFVVFFQAMLKTGIYIPPSPFEAWFISTAHSKPDIEKIIRASARAFKAVKGGKPA